MESCFERSGQSLRLACGGEVINDRLGKFIYFVIQMTVLGKLRYILRLLSQINSNIITKKIKIKFNH